jgi:hypothetical protein
MDGMGKDDIRVADAALVDEGAAATAAPDVPPADNMDVAARARRDAWAERYRAANPDAGEDVDDETLFGYADEEFTSRGNAFDELNAAQGRLVDVVQSDPSFAAVLSLVANGEPFEYAVGKIIGNPEDVLEGRSLDDYRRGKTERDAEAAQWAEIDGKRNENLQSLLANIESFGKENGLTEEEVGNLRQGIVEELYNSLMNEYSPEAIGQKWKGMSYDRDVADAAAAGEAAARNAKIVAKRKSMTAAPAAAGRTTPPPAGAAARGAGGKHVDFFRDMKDAR